MVSPRARKDGHKEMSTTDPKADHSLDAPSSQIHRKSMILPYNPPKMPDPGHSADKSVNAYKISSKDSHLRRDANGSQHSGISSMRISQGGLGAFRNIFNPHPQSMMYKIISINN